MPKTGSHLHSLGKLKSECLGKQDEAGMKGGGILQEVPSRGSQSEEQSQSSGREGQKALQVTRS